VNIDYIHPDFTGYIGEFGDNNSSYAAAGFIDFPESLMIPPELWREKYEEANEVGKIAARHRERFGRFTNQSPTHECTCHSLAYNAQAAIRVASGFNYDIPLSPLSVYAEANPRQWGGASILGVARIAMRRGMLPETSKTKTKKGVVVCKDVFAHSLHGTCGRGNEWQDKGPWVSVSRFPEGWEETASEFILDEVVNVRNIEQAISLLIHGYCVGVGRRGHAISYDDLEWSTSGTYPDFFPYADSYDIVRKDSLRLARSATQSAFSVIRVRRSETFHKHYLGITS